MSKLGGPPPLDGKREADESINHATLVTFDDAPVPLQRSGVVSSQKYL